MTAAAGGAVAGVAGGAFIWLVNSLIRLLWRDLPEQFGLEPYGSWWLFAVPIAGGLLVGLGQRLLGVFPEPLDEVIAKWRNGEQLRIGTAPATAVNSLSALATGGPIGFEAALVGLLGAVAGWIGDRIGAARGLVRQAWGAERVDSLPPAVAGLPYWLAAIAGLVAYKSLPFGGIDLGFRFGDIADGVGGIDLLAMAALSAALVVPLAWASKVVAWSETRSLPRVPPMVATVAGGVVFATMALGSEYVLFSGQEVYQHLPDLDASTLAYLAVAKWVALVVALLAGWRGGPVFPMITAASAVAVLVSRVVDVPVELLMVAAVASVAMVFVKGRVAIGFTLSLYVVPLSNAGLILVGCVGAAVALVLAGPFGLLPGEPEEATDP
ncbi:MAG: chloride channel protein [Microthrixaceae bacterium]|nr:chloride channel protein [Microthrixaceae bacterium]